MRLGEMIPTREAYGRALVELGARDPRVVVVEADISKSTKTDAFARAYPDRFFNVGVAEQNAVMVAAGLASCGKIPFVSTYAVFGSMRACEQVRTFVAYTGLNVKLALSHGGLTPGNDGATHQATEDMGIMRTIPNMTVIMPSDAVQTRLAVFAAAEYAGPVYLRFTRDAVPVIYPEDASDFTIGKSIRLREGDDVTIIGIGDLVRTCIKAADALATQGISARVVDMHTLKPLDRDAVLRAAHETGAIVTVEDHNRLNGLGSAVAEMVAETNPVPVMRLGVPDCFGESGPYEVLLAKFGLAGGDVVGTAREAIKMKRR